MGSIKRERVEKINNNCKNGFELDVMYYLMHNDYMLSKIIELDEENYIKAYITYREYRNPENRFLYTGKYEIYLNVSKWYHKKGEDFASSSGLGKSILISEELFDKKAIKTLEEYTSKVNDEMIMNIYNEYYAKILDKIII